MPVTYNTNPVHDTGTGEHSQVDEPQTFTSSAVDPSATGDAEPQGDEVTFTADHVDNNPEPNDTPEPEPQTYTSWPHEAIIKTVAGEDKTVKETPKQPAARKKS